MTVDSFENKSLSVEGIDINSKLSEFNKSFDSSVKSVDGIFKNTDYHFEKSYLPDWLKNENPSLNSLNVDSVVSNVKQMYSGVQLSNGEQSLGLRKLSTWNGDLKDYSVLRSRAGYAAEVISTAKENIENDSSGNGIKTYRADDLPELFEKNDQYVDKVRVDSEGKVIETIQTKFVGKNGTECYDKLMSKKFDKYFTEGKVDKIEIPNDFYDEAKQCLQTERESLIDQIKSDEAKGKTEELIKHQAKLEKMNQLDEMLEQSNTTSTEAIQAAKHPKLYTAKQMMPDVAKKGAMDGVKQAKTAMLVTGAISTVDNVSKCIDGDITTEEAVKNIAVDTGTAGAGAFSVGFVSSTTASLMRSSSNELIRNVGAAGDGCLPAAAVSYGIEVHGTVIEYAKGNIDDAEFVDEMGRSGAKVAGGMIGGSIGSVAGPAGTFAGATVGSELGVAAYDATQYAANKAVDIALGETTIEEVSTEVKEAVEEKVDEKIETAKETAEDIKEIADYVAEETGLDETVADAKETVEKTIEDTSEKIEEVAETTKKEVEETINEVGEKIEETADKTVETVKDYEQSAKELVSSTVNYAVTSEAYVTAVESCEGAIDASAEELGKLENKAKEYANKAIDKAGDFGADAAKDVKDAINNFNIKNSLPFSV